MKRVQIVGHGDAEVKIYPKVKPGPMSHSREEFVYVLKGRMRYRVGSSSNPRHYHSNCTELLVVIDGRILHTVDGGVEEELNGRCFGLRPSSPNNFGWEYNWARNFPFPRPNHRQARTF